METLIFVLHIISCLFLIGLILIQRSQGSDIGAAFGGASQTLFGSRGPATFLNKLTIIVAVIFFSASVFLAHAERNRVTTSVVDEAKKIEQDERAAGESILEEEKAPVEEVDKGITPEKE